MTSILSLGARLDRAEQLISSQMEKDYDDYAVSYSGAVNWMLHRTINCLRSGQHQEAFTFGTRALC